MNKNTKDSKPLLQTAVSTRFSFSRNVKGDFVWMDDEKTEVIFVKNINGKFVWMDDEKTEVIFVKNINGKFITGIDPYVTLKWWQKLLSYFRLYKIQEGSMSILRRI
jgi:hypothetical protein